MASSIHRNLLYRKLRARVPLYKIPATANVDDCIYNGLINTEPFKPIGTKLSFQRNHASFSRTTKAAFVLDALPVNAAFQSALSKNIVSEYQELWSGM